MKLSSCLVALLAILEQTCSLKVGINENKSFFDLFHRYSKKKDRSSDFEEKPIERPLFIGAFNVQTLSTKKLSDDSIMVNLEKVVHRYDLILITELMTNNKRLIDRFLSNVNRFAPKGIVYNLTMNNYTQTIQPAEYCAFLYRIDKLKVLKVDSYADPNKFYRTPFFVLFQSSTLRDMKQFGAIGFHVKPKRAVEEIDALSEVYDFMIMKHKVKDILLMGDFNADCDYVKEKDWEKISLWTRSEFTWPIGNHVDTTTNYKSCALDRFVYAGDNMNAGVIMSSARSLDLQEELGLTLEEARFLSDHKPIELRIRGKASALCEKHLTSDICFSVKDSRVPNTTLSDAMKAAKMSSYTAHFNPPHTITMKNETKTVNDMIEALKSLRSAISSSFTKEQLEAILYKLEEGALDDESSYADKQKEIFEVKYQISNDHTNVMICRTTTIN